MSYVKSIFASKTFWSSIAKIVGGWCTYFVTPSPEVLAVACTLTVTELQNIAMRFLAEDKVTLSGK